jgi:hypothetical protein
MATNTVRSLGRSANDVAVIGQASPAGDARRVRLKPGIALTREEIKPLLGNVIVVEGGIGRGKTSEGREICRMLNELGIPTKFYQEPIEKEEPQKYLRKFMEYQRSLPVTATHQDRSAFETGRMQTAQAFQFCMMEERTKIMKEAGEFASNGGKVRVSCAQPI